MNFLAHLYLSGSDDEIKTGNFIADAVKGRLNGRFSPGIQQGIQLHRAIDTFTDTHPVVTKSKLRLRESYGKHAGIVIDIFYDHFLSIDWERYSQTKLSDFIHESYFMLIQKFLLMPFRVQKYFPFLVVNNWLEKYSRAEGIEQVLTGMARYRALPAKVPEAMQIFNSEYEAFRNEFTLFFPELIRMVEEDFGVEFG
ncbi:MAG: ACP phosphodiesterase [Bacteroidales bacterium]|nr:ACP phosphodiesterase [Bacteroidales bacterium]MCF8454789.1 ACP phosphodiesterase [Bacteroidales bacterium]